MEEINVKLNYLKDTKELIRQAIIDKDVDVPKSAPFSAYPDYIKEITTVPTFESLKKALNNGTAKQKFPVGTEVPDTYDGTSSPWTVMDYGEATLSDGSKNNGLYLVRLIANLSELFTTASSNWRFYPSEIYTFLNETYLNHCSEEFKAMVEQVQVPYYYQGIKYAFCKCWLLSNTEIIGVAKENYADAKWQEGYQFELWKQRTGLSEPNNNANNGRIIKGDDNVVKEWWTRTTASGVNYVNTTGAIVQYSNTSYIKTLKKNLVVACFIRSDS